MAFDNRTDSPPFFLECGNFFGGLAPIGAVLEGFSLFAESDFLFEVGGIIVLNRAVEFAFEIEELVASLTEAGEERVVHLLRSKTDFLPISLSIEDGLSHRLPSGVSFEFVEVQRLNTFAYCGFCGFVCLFAFFTFLEVGLVTLVHHCRCVAEAIPDILAVLFCNRTYFAPFNVKFLQQTRSHDYVVFLCEFFGFFTEGHFLLEVLLEVEVTQTFVYLKLVVEMFKRVLETFPERFIFGFGHIADSAELFAQLLNAAEMKINIVDIFRKAFDFGDDFILFVKV